MSTLADGEMRNLKDCWNRPKTGEAGGRERSLTTSALYAPVDGHRLRQPGAYSFLIRDNQTPCPFWLQKGQRNPRSAGIKVLNVTFRLFPIALI